MAYRRLLTSAAAVSVPASRGSPAHVPTAPVVMVLSTGRCGTQWLAAGLRRLYPELTVEHEPIGPLYSPRHYFRRYDDPEAILAVPAVARHVERIERCTSGYVETGWPLFPVLPLLAARLGERLRVVHLTRHPVPTALSHLAHSSYAESPRDDAYTRLATLAPQDPNVFQPSYATDWETLMPYEKCLFWWTEVSLLGLEFPGRYSATPFARVKAEDVLTGRAEALAPVLALIGARWDERWLEHAGETVDRWHHHTDQPVDPLKVHRHPTTVEVAERLGYDVRALNLNELRARYEGEPDPGLDRIGRFAVR